MSLVQKALALAKQEKECLLSNGERSHFSKGQVLFYQDHNPSGIYWILSGQIVLIHVENGQEHSEYKSTDDLLGIEELLKGETFRFTAKVLSDCEICFIPKVIFQDWKAQHEL